MPVTDVVLSPDQIDALDGLEDWRFVLNHLRTDLRAGSFSAAGALAAAIAVAADAADHHPDLSLRYPDHVLVALTSHSAGGVTTRDVELARHISDLARAADATADPGPIRTVEIAIDTTDSGAIRGFWRSVLGYRDAGDVLVDPLGVGPPVWFQEMDPPRTERNRIHIDVSVPAELVEARVAAAIEAGGRLVDDSHARAWWVLADADGNEACICSWLDR